MAGHSKWATTKHKKFAKDAKKANVLTKAYRNILVAAKSGLPDPNLNAKLALAISNAKSVNMPKDRIEMAIKNATSHGSGENYEEIRYNGYLGGVGIIIEVLTDNKNRSASDVRAIFTKHGGALGETGSVEFMFQRVGVIEYTQTQNTFEELFDIAIECGAEDIEDLGDNKIVIYTKFDDMHNVRNALNTKIGESSGSNFAWIPTNLIDLNEDEKERLETFLDKLDDMDDVQEVFHNGNI